MAPTHPVRFTSGRTSIVPEGTSIFDAARAVGEPIPTECGGRGECGLCIVAVLAGTVPERSCEGENDGVPLVRSCQTPVQGPITVRSVDGLDSDP